MKIDCNKANVGPYDSCRVYPVFFPKHGIEVRPVFRGDFDRFPSRGCHQVRINLWGWPASVIEMIMRRNWIKRHMEPDNIIQAEEW
jgi:hypothetical protein